MPRKSTNRPIAVIDFETDPFLNGRPPRPFCVCFHSATQTRTWWGPDCATELLSYLASLKTPHLIYAHNGGKFDYHFLHGELHGPVLVIKNRIVKSYVFHHELRDSYSILPVPLKDVGEKRGLDKRKLESFCRELYKDEILEYCIQDCVVLYEAVTAFIARFGKRMTIGSVAIQQLRTMHPHSQMNSRHDAVFRPYYLGGRVQCFRGGELSGPWKLLDVNSMYPYVMAFYNHPINGRFVRQSHIPNDMEIPFFVRFTGSNRNALPSRNAEGRLVFNLPHGEFLCSNHELRVALEYGLVSIDTVHEVYVSQEYIKFDKFIELYAAEKEDGKRRGDVLQTVFAKLLMNSAYGKEGSNPANFEDWIIHKDFGAEPELREQLYKPQAKYDAFHLWARKAPIRERSFHDVAIAASITSAARAVLLEGLQAAEEPVYCDTDSIICRDFHGSVDRYKLGHWDLEKTADHLVLAGKKLYALYNDQANVWDEEAKKYTNIVKVSCKGGILSLDHMKALCRGDTVRYEPDAPTFSLHGRKPWIPKVFKATWADPDTDPTAEFIDETEE